jgi:hypothetical protein
MASTFSSRAFAVILWDPGLATYSIVAQDGGFSGVVTTNGPGDLILHFADGNFAPLIASVIDVSGIAPEVAGSAITWGAAIVEMGGLVTGELVVTSTQEQFGAPSILAGVSFRVLVLSIQSPSL